MCETRKCSGLFPLYSHLSIAFRDTLAKHIEYIIIRAAHNMQTHTHTRTLSDSHTDAHIPHTNVHIFVQCAIQMQFQVYFDIVCLSIGLCIMEFTGTMHRNDFSCLSLSFRQIFTLDARHF